MKNNVRFQVIGDIERLLKEVQQKLQETMEHTANNSAMTMVVALSYSSRWEIVKATQLIQAILAKNLPIGQQSCAYREILYDDEISMISAF